MYNLVIINGSDHAEYTRKGLLAENESKRYENKKGLCGLVLHSHTSPFLFLHPYTKEKREV